MLLFFSYSLSWADVTQELLYKVSQNGTEVGQRTVQITYIPVSEKDPMGGKKIEFQSKIRFSVAGIPIDYAQNGVAYFSSGRSSFVVSNQINETLVEYQGKKTSAGGWSVFIIGEGRAQKVDVPLAKAHNLSVEMFGVKSWYEDDFMDLLLIDGGELYSLNGVCKYNEKISNPTNNLEKVDRKMSVTDGEFKVNSVYTEDDILLSGNISIHGVEVRLELATELKDLYFGEVKAPGGFDGIKEKDL